MYLLTLAFYFGGVVHTRYDNQHQLRRIRHGPLDGYSFTLGLTRSLAKAGADYATEAPRLPV